MSYVSFSSGESKLNLSLEYVMVACQKLTLCSFHILLGSPPPNISWLHLSSQLLFEMDVIYLTLNSFIFQKIPSWTTMIHLEHYDTWR